VVRGHEAVIAPILRIVRTDEPPPSDAFAAVILTSTNAVPALASIAPDWPIFAVGERTGSAAAEAGLGDVRIADGDAASLAALIARTLPPDAKLLHVAGRERKPEPQESLNKAGFTVTTWAAYDALAAERLPRIACTSLHEGRLDAALHYSRRSAGVLLGLIKAAGLMAPFLSLAHVCLSADAAAPLRGAGARHFTVAERSDEDALLDALDHCAAN
jgi:uroporphyrinogen-III synthase